jgi:hypothetical protein
MHLHQSPHPRPRRRWLSDRAAAAAPRPRRRTLSHERRVGHDGASAGFDRVVVAVRRARPVVADRARRALGATQLLFRETAFICV